ncbi:hypothetical protein HY642_06110 [Candidatus Woesearchaeota archaeon]|nr:hypothetical protein [Candidatus Woesearchaeota archaeon]
MTLDEIIKTHVLSALELPKRSRPQSEMLMMLGNYYSGHPCVAAKDAAREVRHHVQSTAGPPHQQYGPGWHAFWATTNFALALYLAMRNNPLWMLNAGLGAYSFGRMRATAIDRSLAWHKYNKRLVTTSRPLTEWETAIDNLKPALEPHLKDKGYMTTEALREID